MNTAEKNCFYKVSEKDLLAFPPEVRQFYSLKNSTDSSQPISGMGTQKRRSGSSVQQDLGRKKPRGSASNPSEMLAESRQAFGSSSSTNRDNTFTNTQIPQYTVPLAPATLPTGTAPFDENLCRPSFNNVSAINHVNRNQFYGGLQAYPNYAPLNHFGGYRFQPPNPMPALPVTLNPLLELSAPNPNDSYINKLNPNYVPLNNAIRNPLQGYTPMAGFNADLVGLLGNFGRPILPPVLNTASLPYGVPAPVNSSHVNINYPVLPPNQPELQLNSQPFTVKRYEALQCVEKINQVSSETAVSNVTNANSETMNKINNRSNQHRIRSNPVALPANQHQLHIPAQDLHAMQRVERLQKQNKPSVHSKVVQMEEVPVHHDDIEMELTESDKTPVDQIVSFTKEMSTSKTVSDSTSLAVDSSVLLQYEPAVTGFVSEEAAPNDLSLVDEKETAEQQIRNEILAKLRKEMRNSADFAYLVLMAYMSDTYPKFIYNYYRGKGVQFQMGKPETNKAFELLRNTMDTMQAIHTQKNLEGNKSSDHSELIQVEENPISDDDTEMESTESDEVVANSPENCEPGSSRDWANPLFVAVDAEENGQNRLAEYEPPIDENTVSSDTDNEMPVLSSIHNQTSEESPTSSSSFVSPPILEAHDRIVDAPPLVQELHESALEDITSSVFNKTTRPLLKEVLAFNPKKNAPVVPVSLLKPFVRSPSVPSSSVPLPVVQPPLVSSPSVPSPSVSLPVVQPLVVPSPFVPSSSVPLPVVQPPSVPSTVVRPRSVPCRLVSSTPVPSDLVRVPLIVKPVVQSPSVPTPTPISSNEKPPSTLKEALENMFKSNNSQNNNESGSSESPPTCEKSNSDISRGNEPTKTPTTIRIMASVFPIEPRTSKEPSEFNFDGPSLVGVWKNGQRVNEPTQSDVTLNQEPESKQEPITPQVSEGQTSTDQIVQTVETDKLKQLNDCPLTLQKESSVLSKSRTGTPLSTEGIHISDSARSSTLGFCGEIRAKSSEQPIEKGDYFMETEKDKEEEKRDLIRKEGVLSKESEEKRDVVMESETKEATFEEVELIEEDNHVGGKAEQALERELLEGEVEYMDTSEEQQDYTEQNSEDVQIVREVIKPKNKESEKEKKIVSSDQKPSKFVRISSDEDNQASVIIEVVENPLNINRKSLKRNEGVAYLIEILMKKQMEELDFACEFGWSDVIGKMEKALENRASKHEARYIQIRKLQWNSFSDKNGIALHRFLRMFKEKYLKELKIGRMENMQNSEQRIVEKLIEEAFLHPQWKYIKRIEIRETIDTELESFYSADQLILNVISVDKSEARDLLIQFRDKTTQNQNDETSAKKEKVPPPMFDIRLNQAFVLQQFRSFYKSEISEDNGSYPMLFSWTPKLNENIKLICKFERNRLQGKVLHQLDFQNETLESCFE